jgi:SAM-dependent methyltransferase
VGLRERVPEPVKTAVRPLVESGRDLLDRRRGVLLPPKSLRLRVPGNFRAVGAEVREQLKGVGGLRPDDRLLDLCCGVGRIAIPLTGYLGPQASYSGIDVWAEGIRWCQQTITPRFANFEFQYLDARNPKFNPGASRPLEEAALPFTDGSFDMVLMCAILQLTTADVRHLVAESARLLVPGGTFFSAWLLLDEQASVAPDDGRAVAFEMGDMRSLLASCGLSVDAVHFGEWSGRSPTLGYQDIVIAHRS